MYKATISTLSSFAIAGFLLVGAGGFASAQNTSSPDQTTTTQEHQQDSQAHHGRGHHGKMSATGCLEKGTEAGTFSLKTDSGKTYDLTSQKVQLEEHVGHKVTVHGYAAKTSGSNWASHNDSTNAEGSHAAATPNAAEDTNTNEQPSAGASAASGQQDHNSMMTVTKLKMVSTDCSTM